jgi:hypothetical protein
MGSTPRGLLEEVIESLPLPQIFDVDISRTVELTRGLIPPAHLETEPIWSLWEKSGVHEAQTDFDRFAGRINYLVCRSYGLDESDFRIVSRYLEGMTNPWINATADVHIPRHPNVASPARSFRSMSLSKG